MSEEPQPPQPSNDNIQSSVEQSEDVKKVDLLTGQETADRIEEMYGLLDCDAAARLIEPSNALAVAGLKGINYLYGFPLDKQEHDRLSSINEKIVPQGLELWINTPKGEDIENLSGTLTSLRGYAYKSLHSQKILPLVGIAPYSIDQGFEGLREWARDKDVAIMTAVEQGTLPQIDSPYIIYEGIDLGYPDQAIIDFVDWCKTHKPTVEADILSAHKLADKYHGPVPEFDYYPESAQDPEIVEYIANARRILKDFYDTPWVQKTTQSQVFKDAYERVQMIHKKMLDERRKNNPPTK